MMRPQLIVFEGLDGTGKSTLARLTACQLGAEFLTVPDQQIADARPAVDAAFQGHPGARHLFYAACVRQASDKAGETLRAGRSVVLDRYWLSTLVYAKLEPSPVPLELLADGLRVPDLTVYVDAADEVRRERMSSRGNFTDYDDRSLRQSAVLRRGYSQHLRTGFAKRVLALDSTETSPIVLVSHVMEALRKQTLNPAVRFSSAEVRHHV